MPVFSKNIMRMTITKSNPIMKVKTDKRSLPTYFSGSTRLLKSAWSSNFINSFSARMVQVSHIRMFLLNSHRRTYPVRPVMRLVERRSISKYFASLRRFMIFGNKIFYRFIKSFFLIGFGRNIQSLSRL